MFANITRFKWKIVQTFAAEAESQVAGSQITDDIKILLLFGSMTWINLYTASLLAVRLKVNLSKIILSTSYGYK